MDILTLAAWLCSLPALHDGNGLDIPRPAQFCPVVATVALEHPEVDVRLMASLLDVIAAHESGYRTHPHGWNDGGKSKGAFQTPASTTPDDPLGQTRLAARILTVSMTSCPEHPLSLYASGRCATIRVAELYAAEARREALTPLLDLQSAP